MAIQRDIGGQAFLARAGRTGNSMANCSSVPEGEEALIAVTPYCTNRVSG